MSDKELLELAAKANGHGVRPHSYHGRWYKCGQDIEGVWIEEVWWNPLSDDGDALRLAVKLGMRLSTHCNYKMACASDIHMRAPAQVVPWGGDQESAVRQSIVLLAAAIGATL